MRPYAELPVRAARQILADLLGALCLWVAVRVALAVRDQVLTLVSIGERVEDTGKATQDAILGIGDTLADVPLIGDTISAPFVEAANSAGSVTAAGVEIQQRVRDIADAVGWGIGIPLAGMVLVLWLTPRIVFMVRSRRVRIVAASAAGRDLLALRALMTEPAHLVARKVPNAAQGWREGDRDVIAALSALSLERAGLRGAQGRGSTRSRASRTP